MPDLEAVALHREFLDYFRQQWLADLAQFKQQGQVRSGWCCPDGCCVVCAEEDGGVRCPVCGSHFTWARLAQEET